jgi:ornithine carbamoyltransferase
MNKNFLHINDLNAEEFHEIIEIAKWIKEKFKNEDNYSPLLNKTMAMIFAKPSARTRISFETGFFRLGGHALFLGPNDIGIGKRESVADIARVLSRFNHIIMARLFDHKHILELAEHATIPVINGLTDFNHPCQILADIFTIIEHKGNTENIKISYIGDGNNIVHSWLELSMVIPLNLMIICPETFKPDMQLYQLAKDSGLSNIEISHDPISAIKNSDVIYTDVWASMGQKEEAEKRRKIFQKFQVNTNLMKKANSDAIFMHCLPAERGVEVTDSVCDSKNSVIFDQAENRMHAQNAIILRLMGMK